MNRLLRYATVVLLFGLACSRKGDNAALLYGSWVNSDRPTDTLLFMREGGQDLLQYPRWYNGTQPVTTRVHYRYQQGKLYLAVLGGEETNMQSFAWKQYGRAFELRGNELYPYLSSILPLATYTKVE